MYSLWSKYLWFIVEFLYSLALLVHEKLNLIYKRHSFCLQLFRDICRDFKSLWITESFENWLNLIPFSQKGTWVQIFAYNFWGGWSMDPKLRIPGIKPKQEQSQWKWNMPRTLEAFLKLDLETPGPFQDERNRELTFIEGILHGRHCAKHFICVMLFFPFQI